MDKILTSEVIDVLKRSKINGNSLILPEGKLEANMYKAVNKAIMNVGGKWNTRAKAHTFDGDPTTKLEAMLGTGVAVDEKKKFQAFFTPSDTATWLAELAMVNGHIVLEPSAGHGAIALACRNAGAIRVDCIEMNPEYAEHIRTHLGYRVTTADFLKYDTALKFRRIVMNPPFTKNQDVKHVMHALKQLSDDGILVSVMFGNKDRKEFKKLIDHINVPSVSSGRYMHEIIDIPAGTFKESGTNIATVVLKVTAI